MDEETEKDRPVIDRGSDEAEYTVYKAISQLIEERVQELFIAVHGLNISNVSTKLGQIFPQIDGKDAERIFKPLREYDYFLIGPTIGIVVIEVKHQDFKKDFSEEDTFLPQRYEHGLVQLESINALLNLLSKCTGKI